MNSTSNTRSIPHKPSTEAYISTKGFICIKQEDIGGDHSILLDTHDVPKVILWLQELLKERLSTPDCEYEKA